MSTLAMWLIGILAMPVAGLIGWAFKVHYEIQSLRRHHNNLQHDVNHWLEELLALRDKWIERFGRNGDHK